MELVKVTPENYIRAEIDRTLGNVAGLAGGAAGTIWIVVASRAVKGSEPELP
jgi:hypothetical protein